MFASPKERNSTGGCGTAKGEGCVGGNFELAAKMGSAAGKVGRSEPFKRKGTNTMMQEEKFIFKGGARWHGRPIGGPMVGDTANRVNHEKETLTK